ncbi:DUF362 domain-containing protein [Dehalobacterium formicoaceticum]|uniref:Ferredoxin n=1 Tax=Dehalobacterium formicoaceticum TaxID=51515 RepID=A0ABT1Y3C5_9FIRM|nr:DUF362 domain-containing protein [Dehalobacterium formicoaceticum]MCR6545372.1 DUF362 domain-containing protein [Dehalobacterium formicoaceticum]
MSAKILFSSVKFDKYELEDTLPAKFQRLIDQMDLEEIVKDKWTVIKMHLGRKIGYSTIHPIFVKILTDRLKEYGAKVFITDQIVSGGQDRGYTEDYLGVPITPACGIMDQYFYERKVDFKSLKDIDVAGHIQDAEVMIDLSHVKGHGACGYGGACKNIAMGCVTDRTRQQIHHLSGGLSWQEDLCTHCEACVNSCNYHANQFTEENKYQINFHDCTFCQHCVKICPTNAITVEDEQYGNFQTGMAICTEEVLKTFLPGHVFYINFLTNITALCDCWGFTTPPLVPDIGIMASHDIVAIERASLDAIKMEDLIPAGIPQGLELGGDGHLFQRLHGKNPFIQLNELEKRGLGAQDYSLVEIK